MARWSEPLNSFGSYGAADRQRVLGTEGWYVIRTAADVALVLSREFVMVQKIARIFGVALVLAGILGFVPQATPDGKLLGLFPVNTLHNVVHAVLGLWGLAASGSFGGAVAYLRAQAVIYGLLAVLGLIPATSDLFGLVPLHGADVGLHAALATIAAWAGWGLARERSSTA